MWKYQQTFGIIQSQEWILKTFKTQKNWEQMMVFKLTKIL